VRRETELEFAAIDLRHVLHDVVALVRSDAALQGVQITLHVEPELPCVSGNRIQLQQVLLNLLLNALDAMTESAASFRSVTVRAQLVQDAVRVAVRDEGRGLAGDIERVFEPFYTTKHEGLGMGLSICRSIVRAHGGTLWAENNADRGATFYFTVPVRQR
jgi:two-component system, LuxR family, sensor kinase FixL